MRPPPSLLDTILAMGRGVKIREAGVPAYSPAPRNNYCPAPGNLLLSRNGDTQKEKGRARRLALETLILEHKEEQI